MTHLSFILLCLAIFAEPVVPKCQTENLTSALTRFSASLFQMASKTAGEFDNIIVSPSSVATVLTMTMIGARNSTAKQIKQVLHLTNQEDSYVLCANEALDRTSKNGDVTFTSVNRFLVSQDFPLLPAYRSILANNFATVAENVNFSLPSVADNINQQVEISTRQKIKNLIPKGSLKPSTKAVLVNAVHFKGSWVKAFNPSKNRIEPFYVSPKHDLIPTLMMVTRGRFRAAFIRELDAWALELPYSGSQIKMIILLPDNYRGLARLESSLSPNLINSIDSRLRETLLNVIIPKFKFEAATDLKNVLQRLGVTEVFGDNADLSGMTGSKGLYVSDAFQRAFIEVNEKGTEAAAATVFKVKARSFKPPTQARTFIADHPFVFLIRNQRTKSILFMGRFAKPKMI